MIIRMFIIACKKSWVVHKNMPLRVSKWPHFGAFLVFSSKSLTTMMSFCHQIRVFFQHFPGFEFECCREALNQQQENVGYQKLWCSSQLYLWEKKRSEALNQQQKIGYQPKTEVQKPWIFNTEHLKIILCQNEQFSITGDPSFVVRELLSLKSSTKFLWPFSLVNPVMLPEMFSTFQKTGEKIFETEISAHVGCALGTPNFLDLVGINSVTSSLNRIFITLFFEKKLEGKWSFPPLQELKNNVF